MTRNVSRWAVALVPAALVLLANLSDARAEVSAQRQQELNTLLVQTCSSCHGEGLKGGVGPALLPAGLGPKDAAMLRDTILNGRPGTPMPPFEGMVTAEEADWIVSTLKAGLP